MVKIVNHIEIKIKILIYLRNIQRQERWVQIIDIID